MFNLATKSLLWEAIDNGFTPTKKYEPNCIKTAQDIIAYSLIGKIKNKIIGEIGGDHSRLLPDLAKLEGNKCYNIDKFDCSVGNGSMKRPTNVNYDFIDAFIGNSKNVIEDNFFDITFSISVVEHVPLDQIQSFFLDNIRITKSGGLIVHCIDTYLNLEGQVEIFQSLLREYSKAIFLPTIKPLNEKEVLKPEQFRFTTDLVSNTDDMMWRWNNSSPTLKHIRSTSQNCSIIWAAVKK